MSLAPYFNVRIKSSGRDISDLIKKFGYEDTLELDDILIIDLDLQQVEDLDDEDFVEGVVIEFDFGLIQGETAPIREMEIKTLRPRLETGNFGITLECYDAGNKLKKSTSDRIFKGKTSTQIAQEIADKYDMETNLDTTTKVWEEIPQSNKDDYELLRYLAQREQGGDYIVYVNSNTLYFKKRNKAGESIVTYDFGDPDGPITYFRVNYEDAGTGKEAYETSWNGLDMQTLNTSPSKTDSQSSGAKEGEELVIFNADAVEVGRTGTKKVTQVVDKEEADNITESAQKEAADKVLVGTLLVKLDPNLQPDNVMTMQNASRRYSGNWYIVTAFHTIEGGGRGKTLLTLNKDGTNKKLKVDTVTADEVNRSKGPNETQKTNEVIFFDGNGVPIEQ